MIYSFENTMNELQKYNNFFKMYENIKDVFQEPGNSIKKS